ncbi:hypothetical protein BX616_010042 [Lobosporangium transversale]|uniref:Smr domain-containing protein n=1 Tax=Lobosporangium transversale TaxID=64571 RepID=A0A1Y2GAY6_9FUNG|nr:hypothetical protein BCR41DRAFT_389820 [Lobosporangium transversale]KAF9913431.1 hypothetical protein BX616_010042 [Lobosporangium transversale]ORZ04848.1 hypothetical protein BCR41DRAFT_389820 [Lobosporangium transversale]|eukprot:XP_021876785.1 hypothetical protein BCR41DRAFT_389820 [Lobosporangium transversale]
MDAQEKLEAMFCPRLDSALVASIYHDLQDFKACIPILSELAKATPTAADTTTTTIATTPATTILSSSNKSLTTTPTSSKKTKNTTINNVSNKVNSNIDHTSKSSANNRDILVWSEKVAISNSSASMPRSSGLNRKQGQVTSSSFQRPTSSIVTTTSLDNTQSSSGDAAGTSNGAFRARRNPNYMKNHGLAVDPPEDGTNESFEPGGQIEFATSDADSDQPLDDQNSQENAPNFQKQNKKKTKKGKKQKSSADSETQGQTSTFKSQQFIDKKAWKGLSVKPVEDHFADINLNDSLPEEKDQLQSLSDFEDIEDEIASSGSSHETSTTAESGCSSDVKIEELEFLRSCFPDQEHSDEYLAQILKESNRDLETAVEMILSHIFLENEQVETSSSGSGSLRSAESQASSSTISTLDDAFFEGAPTNSKKKSKRTNSGGNQAAAWGASRYQQRARNGHSNALLDAIDHQDEFLIPESNDWATFEHQISILMNIFHTVPQKTIVSEFHANGTQLFKTVESLERRLKQENHFESAQRRARQSQFDVNLAQLMEMFPDHSATGLKKLLVYSGGDLQDAMNAVLAADIAHADRKEQQQSLSSPSSSSKRGNMIPFQADIRFADKNYTPAPTSNGNRLKSLPSTSNPFPGGARPFPNTILDKSNSELYNDDDDPMWCRQRAHELLEQRNELFRKAAKAYQSTKGKGAGMSGIAAYYADEGKKLDAQGKQWHMRAARAVVQQHRRVSNDPNLVDLHGLTTAEAQTVVKEAVTQWFARATMQASRIAAKPLKIVCGIGSHSKDKIARLYPSVLSLLMKDGWRCEAENGVILVKGVSRLTPSPASKVKR